MIIAKESDRERITQAFQILTHGINSKWDKQNKRLFHENISKFANIARAFTFKK